MRWINVNSVEELKTLGKLRDVTWEIKQDLYGMAKISSRSWNGLYEKIVQFRELLQEISTYQQNHNSYFTTKANEYIFYLTELDGDTRMKKLGVTKNHYKNKKKAKKWRDEIVNEIQPNINTHPKVFEAISILNEIYTSMENHTQ